MIYVIEVLGVKNILEINRVDNAIEAEIKSPYMNQKKSFKIEDVKAIADQLAELCK